MILGSGVDAKMPPARTKQSVASQELECRIFVNPEREGGVTRSESGIDYLVSMWNAVIQIYSWKFLRFLRQNGASTEGRIGKLATCSLYATVAAATFRPI